VSPEEDKQQNADETIETPEESADQEPTESKPPRKKAPTRKAKADDSDDADAGAPAPASADPEVDAAVASVQEMISYVVTAIARNPDAIEITHTELPDNQHQFTLKVDEEDKGRVIGREGRVAEAIRLLMRVAAVKTQIRVRLDII